MMHFNVNLMVPWFETVLKLNGDNFYASVSGSSDSLLTSQCAPLDVSMHQPFSVIDYTTPRYIQITEFFVVQKFQWFATSIVVLVLNRHCTLLYNASATSVSFKPSVRWSTSRIGGRNVSAFVKELWSLIWVPIPNWCSLAC